MSYDMKLMSQDVLKHGLKTFNHISRCLKALRSTCYDMFVTITAVKAVYAAWKWNYIIVAHIFKITNKSLLHAELRIMCYLKFWLLLVVLL